MKGSQPVRVEIALADRGKAILEPGKLLILRPDGTIVIRIDENGMRFGSPICKIEGCEEVIVSNPPGVGYICQKHFKEMLLGR